MPDFVQPGRGTGTAPRADVAVANYAIEVLRSNQDVLLHKVERTQVVREQLEINRQAIAQLKEMAHRGI